jgi:hypothetical protein
MLACPSTCEGVNAFARARGSLSKTWNGGHTHNIRPDPPTLPLLFRTKGHFARNIHPARTKGQTDKLSDWPLPPLFLFGALAWSRTGFSEY